MNRPRKKDKHLPPCVYQKHGAFWLVKAGKWQRLGTELALSLAEYARLFDGDPAGSMPALIERVYAKHTPGLAEWTRKSYRTSADTLKRKLAQFSPEQVKSKHVVAIRDSMADNPNSANKALSFLQVVFAQALEWQIVDGNPCIGVKRLGIKARDRYITDAEYAAIKAHAGDRLRIIMTLCYHTAQRISDVLALRESDITEAGMYFKASKTKDSTQVRFVVAWTDELREAVADARRLQGPVRSLTLLRGKGNKAPIYRSVYEQWVKACEAAGVDDATPHDLRAKGLTDADRQGQDATALAGHADKKMTERYLRLRQTPTVHGPSFRQSNRQAEKRKQ